jgi:dienelactone hydrolase
VRAAFLALLDRPKVPLDAEVLSTDAEGEGLVRERIRFAVEKSADGEREWVPALLIRPADNADQRPAVVVLHGTGGHKEGQRERSFMVELARRGIIGVAIDARYHGERSRGARGAEAYNAAIVRAWRARPGEKQEHPWFFDTSWDIWRTLDYLETRKDVDATRLGMIGFSMGGVETWLAGAVDRRVKVAVPAISVQSVRWSLENDRWQGRANTIKSAHAAAAFDLGKKEVDREVCRTLWNKVVPGLLDQFDAPSMLRLFAPDRALLILSSDNDPNCPIEGARLAFDAAEKAYGSGAKERLAIDVAQGVGHRVTDEQQARALAWFTRWLAPKTGPSGSQ